MTALDPARLRALRDSYRDGLLEDTLPFWLRHAPDREAGGWFFCLDRDGRVVDTDKPVWITARFTWLLATLCCEVEDRPRWRAEAQRGVAFLRAHGFAEDGRMLFLVDRHGRPLRQRRYAYSEAFTAFAYAAWHRLSGDARAGAEAVALLEEFVRAQTDPQRIPPKVDPVTRPMVGLAAVMMRIATAQAVRTGVAAAAERCTELIDAALDELTARFVKPDLRAVLEVVSPDGTVLDHFDGRTLNPGHAIEAAWFVLAEAAHRGGDAELEALGCAMLDWMWQRGWDPEHGGLLSFVDLHGGPVQEYWHAMKFWWPHNEAVLATLLAYEATGEERYVRWHGMVHDWAHAHFADAEHGEWFGYLHRDGSRASTLKGGHWKGPFHLPRMQLLGWQACERLLDADA